MLVELAPCLQLVAPVGMDIDAQDMWFEAAMKALAGMPIGLLRRGAAVAMEKADHPSKIVPTIMGEVREAWDRRKRLAASAAPALPAPDAMPPAVPHEETQAILQRVWKSMGDHDTGRDPTRPARVEGGSDRPARVPTREDYIAMGVDPAVLDVKPASEAA